MIRDELPATPRFRADQFEKAMMGGGTEQDVLDRVPLTPAPSERQLQRPFRKIQASESAVQLTHVLQGLLAAACLVGLVVVGVLVVNEVNEDSPAPAATPEPLALSSSVGVSTESEACDHVALGVLSMPGTDGEGKQPGTAVDAAVAAALCLAVVHPFATNLGGDGIAVVGHRNDAGGAATSESMDFRGPAPSTVDIAAYIANPELAISGKTSVTLPTLVKGLRAAHAKWGRKDWSDLVQPALRLAKDGFAVSPRLHQELTRNSAVILAEPLLQAVLMPGGRVPAVGATLTWPALATSLETIATAPDSFYTSGAFHDDLVEAGLTSHLPPADMSRYLPTRRATVQGSLGRYVTAASPPPSAGFLALSALNTLDALDRSVSPSDPRYYHQLVEAQKHMLGQRYLVGDVSTEDHYAAILALLTPDSARDTAARIPIDGPGLDDAAEYGHSAGVQYAPAVGTAGIAIVDHDRMAFAMTTSMGSAFGSGIFLRQSGAILNNHMSEFSLDPESLSALDPNRKPPTTMAPIVVLDGLKTVAAVAGGGGVGGLAATVQVTRDIVTRGEDPEDALALPRALASLNAPGSTPVATVMMEPNMSVSAQELLIRMGNRLSTMWSDSLPTFPAVGYIQALRTFDSLVYYGEDPRQT